VAIGSESGKTSQQSNAVAIGNLAGFSAQQSSAVAIGNGAGKTSQQSSAVAIGNLAGFLSQTSNSIILNATGEELNNTTSNTFTVKPVRAITSINNSYSSLYYNTTSGEIVSAANLSKSKVSTINATSSPISITETAYPGTLITTTTLDISQNTYLWANANVTFKNTASSANNVYSYLTLNGVNSNTSKSTISTKGSSAAAYTNLSVIQMTTAAVTPAVYTTSLYAYADVSANIFAEQVDLFTTSRLTL
jgi:hypothetical protein